MNSEKIRKTFLDFFKSKQHEIVASAPMVVKNDPTLMFTNAGMNQFKDLFLGNSPIKHSRIADTQKCLRVSGKHNDLEEVGHDTYHHTMFEMLGNWSFGDYFKKEAIEWAWELLTETYKIDKSRIYVTVFGGDKGDGLEPDMEAFNIWKNIVAENMILYGSKKDNFWEMGDTGPCGPCSEVHVDIRDDEDRIKIPGADLVNKDNPLVIEVWNLVFIEFNRLANGSLQPLPNKHVDTGMGFERLCMILQGTKSNYDTDVFQPYIKKISELSGKPYGKDVKVDIAMRVIADHLRAIAFAIADGELPSNNKAGYVIRRILRRAVRYGYTFLDFKEPFVNKLVPVLVEQMGNQFPELPAQRDLIEKVIAEEENSFLKTLEIGIHKFDKYVETHPKGMLIDGKFAFELFDTYGFPIDLTCLMAKENALDVDMDGFKVAMEEQKNRSRAAATLDVEDWIVIKEFHEDTLFLGYENLKAEVNPVKYRKVKSKGKEFYQIVLDKTPFYAESGGQVGDRGVLVFGSEKIIVTDTQKENNLSVHITEKIPSKWSAAIAQVDEHKRLLTENNHSATHLLHAALRKVLGEHVQQKGSLVDDSRLRFDFSHFSKLTDEEISKVEDIVNDKIRQNICIDEQRDVSMDKAKEMGAMSLFGEKYGDTVRVISFDSSFSSELCGGTHVNETGRIGLFKIVSEGAIAAGVRRVEAITGKAAEEYVNSRLNELEEVRQILKNPKETVKALEHLIEEHEAAKKQIELLQKEKMKNVAGELIAKVQNKNGINFLAEKFEINSQQAKDLAFEMKAKVERLFFVIGNVSEGKPGLTVIISDELVKEKGLNAGNIVRELAKNIQGGGGGQPFFATAGGKDSSGLDKALKEAEKYLVK
jgi:alanyl-tRNA synthetase